MNIYLAFFVILQKTFILDVGPVSRTRNPLDFERELHNINIHGGGDCPEMSIYAIREALLLSLDNSYIYVFTDARAKDYQYTPEVLQEKSTFFENNLTFKILKKKLDSPFKL
jgi:hypothetical protein